VTYRIAVQRRTPNVGEWDTFSTYPVENAATIRDHAMQYDIDTRSASFDRLRCEMNGYQARVVVGYPGLHIAIITERNPDPLPHDEARRIFGWED